MKEYGDPWGDIGNRGGLEDVEEKEGSGHATWFPTMACSEPALDRAPESGRHRTGRHEAEEAAVRKPL